MMTKHTEKIKKWHLVRGLILAAAVLSPEQTQADSSVKFHGTLMAASCTPNAMNVEFGEVSLDKVSATKSSSLSGESVRATGAAVQQFTLNLSCSGNINEIKYKWNGTASSLNNNFLATDIQSLAIQISDADAAKEIPPNQWESLGKDIRSKKMLAVLVRDPDATFVGGEFNATATFTIQVP